MKNSLLLLSLHLSLISIFPSASADNNKNNNPSANTSFGNCFAKNASIPQSEIPNILYTPNNSSSFTTVLQSLIRNRRFFNLPTTHKPIFIVAPKKESHVSAAVICAKQHNIHLKLRSGGHDYEGLSYISNTTFAILDMFNFREIRVDLEQNTTWVGAGAFLGELYYQIAKNSSGNLGFPAGVCPTVAVGGFISGGGYGNMLRKYGLSVDHVVDAKIVDVNGTVRNRSSMGEDLFWAIRGGGAASFCVVLSYQISLVPVPPVVTVFRLEKYDNITQIVSEYQGIVYNMDPDLFIRVLLQPVTRNNVNTTRVTFIGMFLGNATRLTSITDSIFPSLRLNKSVCNEMPWINSVTYWAFNNISFSPEKLLSRTPDSVKFLKRKSDYVKIAIPDADLTKLFDEIIRIGKVGMVLNPYGGQMTKIEENATPFPHRRDILYKIQYSVNWDDDEGEGAEFKYIEQIRKLHKFMTPYVTSNPREAYLNYRDLDIGTTDNGKNSYDQGLIYGLQYFKCNFDRLVKIKTVVDPHNFFRNEQSIPTNKKN